MSMLFLYNSHIIINILVQYRVRVDLHDKVKINMIRLCLIIIIVNICKMTLASAYLHNDNYWKNSIKFIIAF